jgi:hypothetical protein
VKDSDLQIPLTLNGVISGFVTRLPTASELDDFSTHVELTSDAKWEPYAIDFSHREANQQQDDLPRTLASVIHQINDVMELTDVSYTPSFCNRLIAAVRHDLIGDILPLPMIVNNNDPNLPMPTERQTHSVVRDTGLFCR